MINQAPFLVVGIPLFTALFIGLIGIYKPKLTKLIGCIGILFGTISAINLFKEVNSTGESISYFFGGCIYNWWTSN